MFTLHEIINLLATKLGRNYQRYFQDVLVLVSFFSKKNISLNEIVVNRDQKIHINIKLLLKALSKLVRGVPVCRITGYSYWNNLRVIVNKRVFIPRVETFALVEVAKKVIFKYGLSESIFLDLCCGTGCISLAVKKQFQKINCLLSDISWAALANAKQNASLYGFNFFYLRSNCLRGIIKRKICVDVIVTNPPYLDRSKNNKLLNKYDPQKALYAKKHGDYFYEKFFQQLPLLAKLPKAIILEIDSEKRKTIIQLFNRYCLPYKVDFFLDCYDVPRVILLSHFGN